MIELDLSRLQETINPSYVPHLTNQNKDIYFYGGAGCYPKGTEFLTPHGWKHIEDYVHGDLVLQYNKETSKTSFVEPTSYIKKPVDQFYNIKTDEIDFTTSKGHRHLLFSDNYEYYVLTTEQLISSRERHCLTLQYEQDKDYVCFEPFNANDIHKVHSEDGIMYCFTVPTGFFVVRQNNKIYVSGNSGKSHFIAQKYILRSILSIQRKHYLGIACFRKTQPAVRKSVYALILQQIHAWNLEKFVNSVNKTEMNIKFEAMSGAKNSQFMCMGLDDKEKLKSIVGVTDAWLEELTEFTHEDLMQVKLRIRGHTDSYKQIIGSFNPTSGNHWIKKKLYDKGLGTFIHTTYKDNQFLDKSYIHTLESLAEQDENYHRIYVLGEWGELKGLIYPDYKIIGVDSIPSEYDTMKLGLDFGFNHPTALVRNTKQGNNIYWHELLYQSNLTTRDLISELNKLVDLGEIDRYVEIIADNSRPEAIQEIYDAGFNIRGCTKGAGSVLDGINNVRKHNLHITSESINLIKEVSMYKWIEDKEGNFLDKPVKFNDDACFVADTKVIMSDMTQKNIKEIKKGDYVMTSVGKKKVLDSWQTSKSAEVEKYTFSDGRYVICTPKHKFITKKGKKSIDSFRYGDNVITWKENKLPKPVRLVAVQNIPTKEEVYNITVSDVHEYYANGILVANCDAGRYSCEDDNFNDICEVM